MRKLTIAAMGIAAVLMGASNVAASAAPPPPLIPDGATGSISVHKYAQPTRYIADNQGMQLPPGDLEGLAPLEGAKFTIEQVAGIDLKTNAGWKKAQSLVDTFDPFNPGAITQNGHGLVNKKEATTNASGLASFKSLPVGLYLVQESQAPTVPANSAVTKSMPFLISVPLTDPQDRQNWVFDVHAYPKNTISRVTKTVNDGSAYALGQAIRFTIDSTIPGGSATTKYVVKDHLDPKLTYRSTTVTIDGQATTDFNATHDKGLVTVTLGATARKAAFDALVGNPNAKVSVTHEAIVAASGEISNQAELTFQREGEPETEVPSTVIETKFGGINVLKHNREGKFLSGAIFEVRASHTKDFATATAVSVNGKSQWATGADGRVTVDGLRYSNWANGATVAEGSPDHNFYWLVEKQAPVGYELLPEPIPFTVTAPVASAATVDVVNSPHNAGGELPKTGAEGSAALLVGGLALIGIGGGALMLSRSRRNSDKA
ncbi:SpaH/EbpB family LPXTG-anchored major pilin [Schaalia sp. JY-X169]|uniref:SpaH/EbpB family LPXTG-anchored major pilin n=1 Tax=Schaalia sp. JY-X169 TaxID=2758572 RepID=UPI0015F3731C|nr:SpaH/EbpB family LPXTG-anchored major pilin [Schaalia sp. JY-X169]